MGVVLLATHILTGPLVEKHGPGKETAQYGGRCLVRLE